MPPVTRPIGLGCMRLSTTADRDDARAIAVLHAALDAGATFLDTADAYCLDQTEVGHNERLVARALGTWPGDRSRVVVATKGGLTRPDGHWVSYGRAAHLTAACEASRRALGVEHFGQSGSIPELYGHYGLDVNAILAAAEAITGRPVRYRFV